MDRSTLLANVNNQTKTRKRGRSSTYYFTFIHLNVGGEKINPTEQAHQKRRQKYASLPEEEKERRRAMARENYKHRKGKAYIKFRL